VERQNVRVEVDDDMLHITGERRVTAEHQERQYSRMERSYGRFERHLRLPASVDREAIRAEFRAGILTITLPKKAIESALPIRKDT
jgi:HSP20 family protein